MRSKIKSVLFACMLGSSAVAQADIVVPMSLVDENGIGQGVGSITVSETQYGIVLSPDLKGLPSGLHGFHLHEFPQCESGEKEGKKVPALAAGGHYDPAKTGQHGTPWGAGHLGDLPPLYVSGEGVANQAVLAPRLKLSDLKGRSLMVHAGGDNHSDHPAPLGGGGARMACGVIK